MIETPEAPESFANIKTTASYRSSVRMNIQWYALFQPKITSGVGFSTVITESYLFTSVNLRPITLVGRKPLSPTPVGQHLRMDPIKSSLG